MPAAAMRVQKCILIMLRTGPFFRTIRMLFNENQPFANFPSLSPAIVPP